MRLSSKENGIMADYGLAMAGGGTRGAAHVGVLSALEEAGLLPDRVAGASAGSIVAGLYASGMTIGDMRETVRWLIKHGRSMIDPDISSPVPDGKGDNASRAYKREPAPALSL